MDVKGADLYDPGNQLESEFFQRVSLIPESLPIAHLAGVRTVHVRQGGKTDALHQVENSVILHAPAEWIDVIVAQSRVERALPFTLTVPTLGGHINLGVSVSPHRFPMGDTTPSPADER